MVKIDLKEIYRCECCNEIQDTSRYKHEFKKILCKACYKKYKNNDKPKVWDKVTTTGRKVYWYRDGSVVIVDF